MVAPCSRLPANLSERWDPARCSSRLAASLPQIRVVGDEPFVMLIAVAPNEDASDETIEPADLPRPG